MAWRKPGILVLSNQRIMGMAEMIIKANSCVVQMGLNEYKVVGQPRGEYFVLRKGKTEISPRFNDLHKLCVWVVNNEGMINADQEESTN